MEQEVSLHIKVTTKNWKRFSKCHVFQVYLVVEKIVTLDVGLCLCVCVCVCVCVVSHAALQGRFAVLPGNMIVSVYDKHQADPAERN